MYVLVGELFVIVLVVWYVDVLVGDLFVFGWCEFVEGFGLYE